MTKQSLSHSSTAGFAAVKAVLILVIIAAIVGISGYILQQKKTANSTLSTPSSSSTAPQPVTATGTTASLDKLTQQEAQTEAGADSSADNQAQQSSASAASTDTNVGGAYDENSL